MSQMKAEAVQEAYSRWAKVYDWTFGPLFTRQRRRAVELMELEAGDTALEVGVGTGLSLPLFPASCRVVGVDFSRSMLEKAARRAEQMETAALVEGDGTRLPFADHTFDGALSPFVVSSAPDPVALLRETLRVCKPGARFIVVNHFSARNRILARLERVLSPVTSRLLGFHADFPLEPLFERAGVEIDHIERATILGSWYLVVLTRSER